MKPFLKLCLPLMCLHTSLSYAQQQAFLGIGGLNYRLLENDLYTSQQLVKESGELASITYGFDYPFYNQFMLHAQAQQSYGIIDYDGQTQTGVAHQTDSTHFVNQGSLSLGYLLLPNSEIYLGIAGQQDIRDVANRGGVYGATEMYTELFTKIGLKQDFRLHAKHRVSLFAESYKPFFAKSFVDLRISDDVTLTLKQGSASAWGIKYHYQYSPQNGLFINYFEQAIRYKNSSQASQTVYGQATGKYIYQPPIRFKQHGITLGMTWFFD